MPFFGLPGNPVAAAITALQLLWPALQRMEGGAIQVLPRLRVRLDQELRRGAGRPELARARLVVAADLLLEIPAELGNLEAGTQLWAQLLRLPIF